LNTRYRSWLAGFDSLSDHTDDLNQRGPTVQVLLTYGAFYKKVTTAGHFQQNDV